MHYTIYKVTNQINGKFYIGSHKTKDLNDKYMGSGKYLKHAQEKYGMENFKKEILFVFDTPEEMYAKEAEIVNADFLAEENTYNLKIGGFGGFDYLNDPSRYKNPTHSPEHTKRAGLKFAARLKEDKEFALLLSEKRSSEIKKQYSDGLRENVFNAEFNKEMQKRAQTDTAKLKRAMTMSERNFQQGKNNSQFGTTWIWHELIGNKKINKTLLTEYIEQGWVKTYKPKFKVV